MKVLNLQCASGHSFEGWFASEDDFRSQCERAMVQCPMCGDASVQKMLSAPRLNLSTRRQERDVQAGERPEGEASRPTLTNLRRQAAGSEADLAAAWLELSRRMVENTQDVGPRFAEEARKMHYGETEERAIRGETSVQEARALLDEGIDVLPLLLPQSLKKPLQ